MLDELISHLREEIALDGSKGTSLKRLWTFTHRFLEEHVRTLAAETSEHVIPNDFTPTIDDGIKAKTWDELRNQPDIFVNKSDSIDDTTRENTPIKQEAGHDHDMAVDEQVNADEDQAEVPQIAAINKKTSNLMAIPEAKSMSFDQMMTEYGNSVVLTTTVANQMQAITGDSQFTITGAGVTDLSVQLLEAVARSREKGITQIELRENFDMDSKSIFYYVKNLIIRGYLIKRPVVVKGSVTQLAVLSRYRMGEDEQDEMEENLVTDPFNEEDEGNSKLDGEATKKRMSRLLETATNQTLTVDDLKSLLGMYNASSQLTRWLNRNINLLEDKGYVERLLVAEPQKEPQKDNGPQKKEKHLRCVHLLKPYLGREADSEEQTSLDQEQLYDPKTECDILADVPLEYQMYLMAKEAGVEGITSVDMHAAMPHVSYKFLSKTLELACKPAVKQDQTLRLYRTSNIDGRKRFYLYFTREALALSSSLAEEIVEEKPKMGRPRKHPLPSTKETNEATTSAQKRANVDEQQNSEQSPVQVQVNDGTSAAAADTSKPPESKKRKYTKKKGKETALSENTAAMDVSSASVSQAGDEPVPVAAAIEATVNQPSQQESKKRQAANDGNEVKAAKKPKAVTQADTTDIDTLTGDSTPRQLGIRAWFETGKSATPEQAVSPSPECISTGSTPAPSRATVSQPVAIVMHPVTPQAPAPIPKSASRTKSETRSKNITQPLFTASYPQVGAPTHIADLKVVDFAKNWKATTINEQAASKLPFKRRQEAILHVLKKHHGAMLFDKIMSDEVAEETNSMGLNSETKLDRKSIIRAAVALGQARALQIYPLEFKKMSGSAQISCLFLLPEVSPNDQVVKDYLDTAKERIYVPPGFSQPRSMSVKKEWQVESLEDRIQRLEASLASNEGNEETKEATEQQIKILEQSKLAVQKRQARPAINVNRLIKIAFRNGYIVPKMIRAKVFMKCLRYLADSYGSNTIPTLKLLQEMPLRAFVQTIGVYVASEEVTNVIENPEYQNTPVSQLPLSARRTLWSLKQNLRSRLKANLTVLYYFGLIRPDAGESLVDGSMLVNNIVLEDKVKLLDYSRAGLPLLEELPISTQAEIDHFWNQLEISCLKADVFPDENEEDTRRRIENARREYAVSANNQMFIPGINLTQSWRNRSYLTDEQIEYLNSYVDLPHRQTPIMDPILCEEIASNMKIDLERVIKYYKQLTYKLLRRTKESRQKQRADERNKISNDRMTVVDVKSQPDEDGRSVSWRPLGLRRGRKGVIFRRTGRHNADKKQDDDDAIPISELPGDDQDHILPPAPKRTRKVWTDQEDELLLYGFAIMKSRRNIRWEPMMQVLKDRKPSSCRQRIAILTKTGHQRSTVYKLIQAWQDIYRQGIQSGELKDAAFRKERRPSEEDQPDGTSEDLVSDEDDFGLGYNLTECLRYFFERLRNDPSILENTQDFSLPNTVDGINEEFNITFSIADRSRKLLDERLDTGRPGSFILKNRILTSTNIKIAVGSMRGDLEMQTTSISADERISNDIKVILKMILLTPGDQYRPKVAYQTLYRYPVNLVAEAIKISVAENVMTRKSYYGNTKSTLPPRTFGMADKFLTQLSGTLPQRIFQQAMAYRNHLLQYEEIEFSPVCSSGMMYCLLDMFAHQKASFRIEDEEEFKKTNLAPFYTNRAIENLKYDFDVKVTLDNKALPPVADTVTAQSFTEVEEATWREAAKKFQKGKHSKAREHICNVLFERGSHGVDLVDLKRQLSDKKVTDQQIYELIRHMQENNPPLAYLVGTANSILVSSMHLRRWLPRLKKVEDNADGKLVPARMWYDMEGEIMQPVLRGCMQLILEQVQRNPGITLSVMLRKLPTVFVSGEIADVLSILENRKCIKSRTIANPKPPSLFSSPRTYKSMGKRSIY
ncbi:hypothetical protein NQZ79_g8359 [Umbelopsis isabellina]|nr:hypothetical protein NQZ79_g8359 [Umbelopsis isabellina]